MRGLRLWLALTLALLLVSRPAIKLVRALEEEEEGFNELFNEGDEEGDGLDSFPEDEGIEDGDDFEGLDGEGEDEGAEDEIPEGDDGDVVALNKETLAEKVAAGKPFLLEFYAPWCGHCKSLAPEYKAAAAELKQYDVLLAKMDATKFEEAAQEYGVEGYPTVLWVEGKKVKQFGGGRSSAEIVSWVKKRVGFAVTTLASEEDAKKFLDEKAALVAAYFKNLKSKEAEAFAASAKEADDIEYVQTDKPAVAKALGLSASKAAALAVVKKEDDKFVSFEGKYEADAITQFAMANRLPLLVSFSDDSVQLIFGGSIKKMVFLFFKDEEYAATSKEFTPIFREFKGKVIFIYINGSNSEMDNVREFFGIEPEDRLGLGFSTEKREDGEKFQMDGDLTFANLKAFTADFVSGKAKAFFKSEKIPEPNDGPVKIVVGNNFEDVVLDPTKDVLLEVYAPWCGHCKALEPAYQKLGEKFAHIDSVVIAKMDGTANEHPDVKVEGFPTLFFYPADNKADPIPVEAERTLLGLAKFVNEHASTKFEPPEIKPEDEPEPAEPEEEDDSLEADEELSEEDLIAANEAEEEEASEHELTEEELAEEAELNRKEEL